jgi:hypothetical protein
MSNASQIRKFTFVREGGLVKVSLLATHFSMSPPIRFLAIPRAIGRRRTFGASSEAYFRFGLIASRAREAHFLSGEV